MEIATARHVFISGGANGIGLATTQELAAREVKVTIPARRAAVEARHAAVLAGFDAG